MASITDRPLKNIAIVHTSSNFEREQLTRPFGFKGGYLTELWQVASKIKSASGISRIGLATQSVLYGDAGLFARYSEAYSNSLMYIVVNRALELIKRSPFTNPIQLLDDMMPQLVSEARVVTQKPDLNINFIYNALVSVDNAAWQLYAAENNFSSFKAMVPTAYKNALGYSNDKIAVLYQVSYNAPVEEIVKAARQGYFVFKIKTGYPGTQAEMLAADMARLTQIHNALKELRTIQTPNGKLIYTMDANGRYEKKETLQRYLAHAKAIGALEQILFYEEPLPENNNEDVYDLEVRIGADESVHDEKSALRRLDQGYQVLVLKGIAKTLSATLKIARLATEKNIPCICADLTVNPILVDWHKILAAHLAPFPGIWMGLMETNGDVNYMNWNSMINYHPIKGANWMQVKNGVFELDDDFYNRSGGIFESSAHYEKLLSC